MPTLEESLARLLASTKAPTLAYSFVELEAAIGHELPAEARTSLGWWKTGGTAAVAADLGWSVTPELAMQRVFFKREGRSVAVEEGSGVVVSRPLHGLAASSSPTWGEYHTWNVAIIEAYYSESSSGRPVYLDVDEEDIQRIAPQRLVDGMTATEALTTAVMDTLTIGAPGVAPFGDHMDAFKKWRHRAMVSDPPPFVALLAFFSSVAEEMKSDTQFGGANYYGRLCLRLGADRDSATGRSILRDFQKRTPALWDGLNGWLLANDGRFGLPTAYAFDHRRFVGLPISQALLRASDMERLDDFFVEYGLRPGHEVSLPDMVRLMKEWVPTSPLSQTAKMLWRKGEVVQQRMASVAIVQLASWHGPLVKDHARTAEAHVRILASLRRLPPRVTLRVVVPASARVEQGPYQLGADSTRPARDALLEAAGRITLTDGPTTDWLAFVEGPDISMPDLLIGRLHLEACDGSGAMLRRDPRRLVILRRDESLSAFIEVDRAELAGDLMLLVHRTLAADLLGVLEQCARPGFARRNPNELAGLPEEWVAFVNVQLVDVPPQILPDDLRALIPLSWTQVAFGGGLSLPGGGAWHTARPPEVRATALGDAASVEATLICLQTFESEEPDEIVLGSFQASAVFPTFGLGLRDGDYEVRLYTKRDRQFLSRASFRLRSAGVRLPDLPSDPQVGHRCDETAWSTLSAAVQEGPAHPAVVRGAVGSLPPRPWRGTALPPTALPAGATSLEDDTESPVRTKALSGEGAGCVTSGAHHWLLEPQVPHKRLWRIHAVCLKCGLERRFPGWAPLRKEYRRPRPVVVAAPSDPVRLAGPSHPDLVGVIESPALDFDTLLDALCYIGRGTWSAFARIAEQVEDSPWFPLEAARLLSALGHLDVVFDTRTLRPAYWAVSPPSLVETTNGWVLAGFRSGPLIQRLSDVAEDKGGRIISRFEAGSPSVVSLEGLDGSDLDSIPGEVGDVGPERVVIVRDAMRRILSACRPLDELAASLPLVHLPMDVSAEIFDPRDGTWRTCAGIQGPGAYRAMLRPIRYTYLSREHVADRRLRLGDSRTVKLLAARDLGVPPLAYDRSQLEVRAHLGSQLPGLYERALVLSSGRPPRKLKDGTVAYQSVPAGAVATIWSLISLLEGGS